MMIKDFIKSIKKTFGNDVEFKATSNDGKIFRSNNYEKVESDVRRGVGTRKKANW